MSTLVKMYPKRSYILTADGWEGRVMAHHVATDGRERIGFTIGRDCPLRWENASACKVIPEDSRVLPCDGCKGDGKFYSNRNFTEGAGPNGERVYHPSICYRCDGHGKVTPKKRDGNRYYDNHVRTFSA